MNIALPSNIGYIPKKVGYPMTEIDVATLFYWVGAVVGWLGGLFFGYGIGYRNGKKP